MPEQILADTAVGDLATANTVISPGGRGGTKAGKPATVSTRTADGDDHRKKRKKKRRDRQINNADELISALHEFADLSVEDQAAERQEILASAEWLGLTGLLPKEWSVSATKLNTNAVVCLEFDPTKAVIPTPEGQTDDGIMRLKVPFYVGDSIARPSGWTESLFFSAKALPSILAAAEKQIKEGQLPLTVYARHSHAVTGDYLPIGRVAGVSAEGNTGYAILEVLDDGHLGTQTQKLVDAKMLNAVSLRSQPDVQLEQVKVNGSSMLSPKDMVLRGIDFAPEGPAMPTYGVQVLAEAVVEPITATGNSDDTTSEQEESTDMEITLEAVRARTDIVSQIEKPVRDELATVTADRDALKARAEAAEAKVVTLEAQVVADGIAAAVKQAVSNIDDKVQKKAAKDAILAEVKDCKSVADAKAKIFDLMLEAGVTTAKAEDDTDKGDKGKAKTPREILAEAFGATRRGKARTEDENAAEAAPTVSTGALPLPE